MAIEFNRASSTQNLNKNTNTPKKADLNEQATSQAAQLSTPAQAAKTGDSVKLSQNALELQSISDKLKHIPDINHEKVQQLKQAVDAGSYTIDSGLIADKLLAFETSL